MPFTKQELLFHDMPYALPLKHSHAASTDMLAELVYCKSKWFISSIYEKPKG